MNKGAARTKHRIPFTYNEHEPRQWTIFDAKGAPVAVCPGNESDVAFIVTACNNYTALKQIARLSRGEIESEFINEMRSPSQNALRELFERIDCKVLRGS